MKDQLGAAAEPHEMMVIGAPDGFVPARKPRESYMLRWWQQVQVPRLHHVEGRAELAFDLCWAQTTLYGITGDEAEFLKLMLGPAQGAYGYRTRSDPNNWLLQRIMAGVNGVVYGIHLQLDTPAQAREHQPLRTKTVDERTAAHTYGGVVGTVLAPGVHPIDLGV